MESSLICEVDSQLTYLQQLTRITEDLKEKCLKLEREKNEAIANYEAMKIKVERLNNKTCTKCTFLENELKKERKEKEKLKKEERAKLLKTIARTLENFDDGNSNHVNQLLTELNCGKLSESPLKRTISLIGDRESSNDEDGSKILVEETMMEDEIEQTSCAVKGTPIIIPETEINECSSQKTKHKPFNDGASPMSKNKKCNNSKENVLSSERKDIVEQANKKLRLSPILSSQEISPVRMKTRANQSAHSPSVLSEIIEAASGSTPNSSRQDEKAVAWKMRPSVVVDGASTSSNRGRKLKQMTLSLARTEKKHDISLSDNFQGGMARQTDEDDVIQPSPERTMRKTIVKKPVISGTLEDPDMTVFNPGVTSTCLPVPGNSSFDRLPEVEKSPKYKYRRETVRKRNERMKLPGQDCDQCTKYYEAAGLNDSREIRARLNRCSRHRDKYQLRANTPPGFWDPVLPPTPENENS